jgi:hypothetical protein
MLIDPLQPAANDVPASDTQVRPDEATQPASAPGLQPRASQQAAPVPPPTASRETQVNIQWDRDQIMIFRFVDKQTGDLIDQIPSDQVLNVVRKIQALLQQETASAASGPAPVNSFGENP